MLSRGTSSQNWPEVRICGTRNYTSATNIANMSLNAQDLYQRQRDTWRRCPQAGQQMILDHIREELDKKMRQEHGIQKDRVEGYDHDWDALRAELESRKSNPAPIQSSRGSHIVTDSPLIGRSGRLASLNLSQDTDFTALLNSDPPAADFPDFLENVSSPIDSQELPEPLSTRDHTSRLSLSLEDSEEATPSLARDFGPRDTWGQADSALSGDNRGDSISIA